MDFEFIPFIKERLERKVFTGLPLTIFILLFVILLGTFVGITESIVNSFPIVKFDETFSQSLFLIRSPFLAQALYFITSLANQTTMAAFFGVGLVYLYFKKELAYLCALLITFLGTEASVYLIKIFINRARPGADIAYYIETSKSFPSGHSAIGMAFFGFLTYYLVHHVAGYSKKTILVWLGSLLIILIGFSRIYLGVHFMSDVLGGFLMGALWLVAGITYRERHFYIDSTKKEAN